MQAAATGMSRSPHGANFVSVSSIANLTGRAAMRQVQQRPGQLPGIALRLVAVTGAIAFAMALALLLASETRHVSGGLASIGAASQKLSALAYPLLKPSTGTGGIELHCGRCCTLSAASLMA